jgi:hypothetical protein
VRFAERRELSGQRDVCNDTPDPPPDGRYHGRIVNDQPVGNGVEVFERFLGVDESSTAEFGEHGFDLAVAGEAAFGRRAQAAIDAG